MRQWIHVLRQFMELFAELYAFLHEGGPQISVRGSHLEPGHYLYVPLYLTVNSSVLVLREECEQVDLLGDDFRIPFSRSAFCLVQQQIQFMRQRECLCEKRLHCWRQAKCCSSPLS